MCKFVENKSENIDVEDYLTEDQLWKIENGNLSEEEFKKLSHKGKEAAILYQMQLVIQNVETFSQVDEYGFSATNTSNPFNYYTQENQDLYGYDYRGFNNENIHRETQTIYDLNGFTKHGVHKETGTKYNPKGYDCDGYNKDGFNAEGYHKETGTKYNPEGYDVNGFDKYGYNEKGEHKDDLLNQPNTGNENVSSGSDVTANNQGSDYGMRL